MQSQELVYDQIFKTSNTTLSTKGSTNVYCYVFESFQERKSKLISYYTKHNFKWNVFLEVNWEYDPFLFLDTIVSFGLVYADVSQQPWICTAYSSAHCRCYGGRRGGRRDRTALQEHARTLGRRSLTNKSDLIPGAAHIRETKEEPHRWTVYIQYTLPLKGHWLHPGHLPKGHNLKHRNTCKYKWSYRWCLWK